MRHFRLTRLVKVAAMLASSLLLASGTVLPTSGPASADAGGVNVCTGFSGVLDTTFFPFPVVTGTLTGCHQQGSGVLTAVLDPFNGTQEPGSVFWAAGHATSVISAQLISFDTTGGPCASLTAPYSGDVALYVAILVGGGPYASPYAWGGFFCFSVSDFFQYNPMYPLTNSGNIVI
jgi:hypothetical protein